ncbi:MAG: bifunctional diaminohydroxyphosphoribosylaminopyrimidine deaminase/5-amino-6-(5-phosphoribosylamino)uracil reductase RibD [Desulfobulbaceae bacterium]|nr:bifunctional diaminohydroxyphosphoribosylaminopyrimidine deaminase/5-amino-6-(5-phosphoribosylamino)uracil reductase RibD [Desulfobulbaceae bacterium]
MADIDRSYMHLALREAKKGTGRTSPNPCVGAVVVKKNKVVGKGYHKQAGTPHAEIHALREAGKKAKDATLYVTLEPCNHTGRTPPCTEAILRAGISRVVIGMPDPNPGVAGGGAKKLVSNGVAVSSSILENECREINLPFIKHTTTGRPWVIIKAGMSIDGKIAAGPGQSTRITGQKSLQRVHALRNQVDAILVGIGTGLVDDPSLTTRLHRRGSGRDPLRLVLDAELCLPESATMIQQESSSQTWIFCGRGADKKKRSKLEEAGAVVKTVPVSKGMLDLKAVLSELGKAQITSVLVEGGSKVHGSFLQEKLADQILLFVAPVFLGDQGVPLASFPGKKKIDMSQLKIMSTRRYGDDVLIDGRFNLKR